MIKWFNEIQETDFNNVGGKGYNLSKMLNNGLNVPNGFVITSTAYEEYIKRNGFDQKIETILNSENLSKEKSGLIKMLFNLDSFCDKLESTLRQEFKKITSGRVAVRSSSTVEDLPGMSFAGQYSTYLNVTEKDLLEKVLLCWQSLWNERAIDYRNKYKITSKFSHAVVVQEMINSQISGVIFTANPLNGIRNELLINAAYGLGEAIVSGEVHPDQYTIDKNNGSVIEEEIASKEILCRYAANGVEYAPVDEARKSISALTQMHIQTIVTEAHKTQDYFGPPQDIEFAFDDQGTFYVLQSRDITSLFPIDNFVQDDKLRAYLCVNTVMLGMKEPFTPLGYDMSSHSFPTIINVMTVPKKPVDNSLVKVAGGRIFVDLSYLLSRKFIGKLFGKSLSANDLPLEDTMNHMINQHGKRFTQQGIKFKIPWGVFKYGFRMMGKIRQAMITPPEQRYDSVKAIGEAVFQKQKMKASNLKTVEEKLEFSQQAGVAAFKMTQSQGWYCMILGKFANAEKTLSKMVGDKFDIGPLTQSFPGCITVEMGVTLNQLAKYFDEAQIAPTKDHPKVKDFLAKFGHRSTVELDFGVKRWSEDPDYIINMVKSYMVDQMYDRNIAEVHEKSEKAEQLIEEIYQTVKADKGERKARKIKKQITGYRIAAGIREYPKFNSVRILAFVRGVMLDVGQAYQADGLIDEAEDIFFLCMADIRNKQGLKQIVINNKEAYNGEMARTSIPRIVLNTGETYYSAQKIDPSSKVLQGMPLSAGIYEGKVRVVFDPNTSELLEGEILVTESTNPAWTPLFMTAKGLIMEYGGPASHGGIVAREYGLPAVVGIPSATNVLKDGQMVRINGETGTIEILS